MADNDSSSSMIVAIIAILVIVALGFVIMQTLPGLRSNDSGLQLDVDLPNGSTSGMPSSN